MLLISSKADYSVFLLGAFARRGVYTVGIAPEALVSAKEIATESGLGKPVVANLLKEFTKEGVLESVRGLKGGYRLTLAPAELTLARILAVVDGPFALTECSAAGPDGADCNLIGFCPSQSPMKVVHERIQGIFDEINLTELCGLERQRTPLFSSPSHR